jgi:hypothetical protein
MVAVRAVLVDRTGQPARPAGRTVQRTHRKDMIMHAWGGGARKIHEGQDRTGQDKVMTRAKSFR